MKVSEIPANKLIVMTPELYQEFAQGGCVPACHLTNKWINIGEMFKLVSIPTHKMAGNQRYGTVENIDVMLAEHSDPKNFIKKQAKIIKEYDDLREQDRRQGRTGCFRINGKIVP